MVSGGLFRQLSTVSCSFYNLLNQFLIGVTASNRLQQYQQAITAIINHQLSYWQRLDRGSSHQQNTSLRRTSDGGFSTFDDDSLAEPPRPCPLSEVNVAIICAQSCNSQITDGFGSRVNQKRRNEKTKMCYGNGLIVVNQQSDITVRIQRITYKELNNNSIDIVQI